MGRPLDTAPRSNLDRANTMVGKESAERTRSIAGRQSEAAGQQQNRSCPRSHHLRRPADEDHTTYFRESVGGLQASAGGRNGAMMCSAQNRMKTRSPEAAEIAVRHWTMSEGNC
jgi:hypothetical protein